ncbi:hypothetical protein T484DRAFT_1927570 [Baffinella frigidus]|nr:hypothetical protein T484DRAFT_1927570 [Cryptophyta sp. CCMP2293]
MQLAAGADPSSRCTTSGPTALFFVARDCNLEMVVALLEKGADATPRPVSRLGGE